MVSVGSIMTRELVTVPPQLSLEQARRRMWERRVRHMPVVEHGELLGMLSERDLMGVPLSRSGGPGDEASGSLVRDRMNATLETTEPNESVVLVSRRLDQHRLGSLPVLHEDRLVGIVSESDLLRFYVRLCGQVGSDPVVDPRVGTCMTRDLVTVSPETRVSEALDLGRSHGVRHLPVVHRGWFLGVVSDHDLLPVIGRGRELKLRVGDVMTRDHLVVTDPQRRLSEVAASMAQGDIHSVPVVVDGDLRGIVTSADVLAVLGRVDERLVDWAWRSLEALDVTRVEE